MKFELKSVKRCAEDQKPNDVDKEKEAPKQSKVRNK